ncbi:MAG: response regulator [Anaerolineae bacterium]
MKNLRVLLVDDSPIALATTRKVIEKLGHQVVGEANNGVGIVPLVQATKPDVVILDLEMPDVNGVETARRLKEKAPVPVVVLTGHTEWSWLSNATEAGTYAYLTKPTTSSELQNAITIAIARFAELQKINYELTSGAENYEALIQAERMAAIAQITTTIRHEINNPLTIVLGNIQFLLQKETGLPKHVMDTLRTVEKSAQRIRRVVQALDDVNDEVTICLGNTRLIDISPDYRRNHNPPSHPQK